MNPLISLKSMRRSVLRRADKSNLKPDKGDTLAQSGQKCDGYRALSGRTDSLAIYQSGVVE